MPPKHAGGRPRSKRRSLFARWIDSVELTYDEVAARLGCTKQFLSNVRAGRTKPGLELANRIAVMSGGLVPTTSWDLRRAKR